MAALTDPQPMATFDPSKAALLHEIANDEVIEWSPDRAHMWHEIAPLFDAWSDVHPGAVHPAPNPEDESLLPYG
jgi:hypothetical protein